MEHLEHLSFLGLGAHTIWSVTINFNKIVHTFPCWETKSLFNHICCNLLMEFPLRLNLTAKHPGGATLTLQMFTELILFLTSKLWWLKTGHGSDKNIWFVNLTQTEEPKQETKANRTQAYSPTQDNTFTQTYIKAQPKWVTQIISIAQENTTIGAKTIWCLLLLLQRWTFEKFSGLVFFLKEKG